MNLMKCLMVTAMIIKTKNGNRRATHIDQFGAAFFYDTIVAADKRFKVVYEGWSASDMLVTEEDVDDYYAHLCYPMTGYFSYIEPSIEMENKVQAIIHSDTAIHRLMKSNQ